MKKLIALIVAVAAFAFTASAQQSGVYKSLTGGTTRVLAASTNLVALGVTSTNQYGAAQTSTNLSLAVSEFDYVGLTWSYGAGSNATVQVFKSDDGGTTYEANPSYSFSGPAASASAYKTNALLDVRGATHIAFVLQNPSTIDQTNAYLAVNLKSPKYGSKPATR